MKKDETDGHAALEGEEKNADEAPAEAPVEALPEEIQKSLEETEKRVLAQTDNPTEVRSWHTARQVVEKFRPVPWFVWRVSNFVLGTSGKINKTSDGMVFGLKKLLLQAASDVVLGGGKKVLTTRGALEVLSSDVVAAVSVIHAVNRRLATKEFARIWGPILDDALLRAQVGFLVGERRPSFGPGRGMLAGFAGRIGLAILIAIGTFEQAQEALDQLAQGKELSEVGLNLYGCDPLQVSAMTLSASGCGRDAAFGTVNYAQKIGEKSSDNPEQRAWLSAFLITEHLRTGLHETIPEEDWKASGFVSKGERSDLIEVTSAMVRRGHGWGWLL